MTAQPDAERVPGPQEAEAVRFMRAHRERAGHDRAALRCAYSDAAHLLDAIRQDRAAQRRRKGESGRIAEAVNAALLDAAEAIWALREDADDAPETPSQETAQ